VKDADLRKAVVFACVQSIREMTGVEYMRSIEDGEMDSENGGSVGRSLTMETVDEWRAAALRSAV